MNMNMLLKLNARVIFLRYQNHASLRTTLTVQKGEFTSSTVAFYQKSILIYGVFPGSFLDN